MCISLSNPKSISCNKCAIKKNIPKGKNPKGRGKNSPKFPKGRGRVVNRHSN